MMFLLLANYMVAILDLIGGHGLADPEANGGGYTLLVQ